MRSQQLRAERAETDRTEARIMRAALRLFASKGYGAVGIREIALEAGVSTAALYHYMRTKEDLLVALMTDRMRRMLAVGATACAEFEDPVRQLVGLVRVHVIAHGHFPDEVVDQEVRSLSAETRPRIIALRDRYERLWNDVLGRGLDSGAFDVPDVRFARLALLEMCNGMVRWYRPTGESDLGTIADAFAEMALGLVRARRGARPLRLRELDMPAPAHHEAIVATVYGAVGEPV